MKTTTLNIRGLVRLIPTANHKPPILRGLVDTDDEMTVLAELEGLSSNRLTAEREGLSAIDRRELAFARREHDLRVYGQSYINAAFTYFRKGGNRFNAEDRGAWYCAFETQTSAAEVCYHRTRELGFIGIYHDEAIYVELLADFIGEFPDIQDEPDHLSLNPNTDIGYPQGQKFADQLRRSGAKGLLYPSVRHPGGVCFVAFEPRIIQNVRPGAQWKFQWNGTPEYTIEGL